MEKKKANPAAKNFNQSIRQTNKLLNASQPFATQMQQRLAPDGQFLGRITAGPSAAMQTFTDELGAMRNGFTPQEQASLDENRRMGFQRQLSGQQSSMARRAANSGLRGTAALAAQADLGQQFAGQEAQAQSDLAAQNVQARERRMGMYGQQLGANQDFTRQGETFNLDQGAAEQAARNSAYLGGLGMFASTVGGQQGSNLAASNQEMMRKYYDQPAALAATRGRGPAPA